MTAAGASLKLLFCIDNLAAGGAQRQMVALADGLVRRGHQVEFYVYYPEIDHFAPEVEAIGATVHAHQKSGRFSIAPLLALVRLLRRNRYDAVLAFLRTPVVYAELAKVVVPGTPLVVSERSMYESIPPALRVKQELHRLADHITVNSHHQRERMTRAFPWMARKISTIYNGVDLGHFRPDVDSYRALAAASGPLRLLAVGSTTRNKNALGLARALAIAKGRGLPVPTVHWAGSPPPGEAAAAAKAEVDAFIAAEDLGDAWVWLGRRADVHELMRQYDALVHPALMEGLPNAICEALASGLPVLAGRVGDNEALVGQDRGIVFDPTDPADIFGALDRFAALSAEERVQMAERGRAFAAAQLSLDSYADRYESLFEDLAKER